MCLDLRNRNAEDGTGVTKGDAFVCVPGNWVNYSEDSGENAYRKGYVRSALAQGLTSDQELTLAIPTVRLEWLSYNFFCTAVPPRGCRQLKLVMSLAMIISGVMYE